MPRRVAVVGSGSIARRHVSNLKTLGVTVTVVTSHPGRVSELERDWAVEASTSLGAVVGRQDAVVVATATDRHIEPALAALREGCGLMIEKPLSHDRNGIDDLIEAAESAGVAIEVGCNMRAHPAARRLRAELAEESAGAVFAFRAVAGQRLDQWRPGTDYRQSYSADDIRGGGVMFDLMHEIDLALWFMGPVTNISARLDHVGDLDIASHDLANLTLETRDGAVGQIQLDYLSPRARRGFEIVCRRAWFALDFVGGFAERHDAKGTTLIHDAGADYDRNLMYLDHMRHFLSRLEKPELEPICGLSDGVAGLDILLAAQRSAAHGGRIERVGA